MNWLKRLFSIDKAVSEHEIPLLCICGGLLTSTKNEYQWHLRGRDVFKCSQCPRIWRHDFGSSKLIKVIGD